MVRKVAVYGFIVIFAFMVVWELPRQEAEAFLPVAVPAALYVPIACALIAGGVQFASQQALESAVEWWYSEAGETARQQVATDFATLSNGIMKVSSGLWESIRNFVQGNFGTVGDAVALTTSMESVLEQAILISSIPVSADKYHIQRVLYDIPGKSYDACVYVLDGKLYFQAVSGSTSPFQFALSTYDAFKFTAIGSNIYISVRYISTGEWYTVSTTASSYPIVSDDIVYQEDLSIPYTGSDIVDIPDYDYAVNGSRSLNIPTDITDLVGKTYLDIQSTYIDPYTIVPVTPTGLTAEPGDNSISLDWDAVPGANYYQIYVAGVVIATGVTATNYLIGNLTNETEYEVGVSAVNNVGTSDIATTTAIPSAVAAGGVSANGIDLTPLKNVGVAFTTKFPFSLPWDILRAGQALTAEANLPNLELQFYNPLDSENPLQFTMSWPDFIPVVAVWIRAAFLVMFGIGLVYGTRKLLGGAQ